MLKLLGKIDLSVLKVVVLPRGVGVLRSRVNSCGSSELGHFVSLIILRFRYFLHKPFNAYEYIQGGLVNFYGT